MINYINCPRAVTIQNKPLTPMFDYNLNERRYKDTDETQSHLLIQSSGYRNQ